MFKFYDVFVVHRLKQFSFLLQEFDAFLVESLPFDYLDSNLIIGLLVYSLVNCAKGTFSKD